MKKIRCLDAIAKIGTDQFDESYSFTESLDEATGVLVRSQEMHTLSFPDTLVAIARAGAGVNNIPLDRCSEQGIVVFNTPGANANGVKELVICSLLLASRDVLGGIAWAQSIRQESEIESRVEKGKKAFAGCEIKRKTLGVIGLGAIGAEVANAAAALGMHVIGYDPYISVHSAWRLSRKVKQASDIQQIFNESDYITLHVPLTDENRGLIGTQTLSMMKKGVVILNFARDLLVDETAMATALQSEKVKHYITDFPNAQTLAMPGCIAIPHLGASTIESEDNCAIMAVAELSDYIDHGNIKNSVNYPACDLGVCQSAGRLAILHRNIPNMIGQITGAIAQQSINIQNMINTSRQAYAYTLIDLESPMTECCLSELSRIEGVLRVRVVK